LTKNKQHSIEKLQTEIDKIIDQNVQF